MKRSSKPRGFQMLARASLGAGILLAAAAGTARADCAAEYSGDLCDITPAASGFMVGGSSSSSVFVQLLGGSAMHGVELFWVPSAEASEDDYLLLNPAKPSGNLNWDAGAVSLQLPGTFAGGSEVLFAARINGGDFFYSGSLASRNPGEADQFNLFGSNATVYLDDRTTPVANTPPGNEWTVLGVEDRALAGPPDPLADGDFNDLVFAVRTTVTPEPATLLLLGTGLAGIAGAARRSRGREKRHRE